MAAVAALGIRLVRLIALALRCPRDIFDAGFSQETTVLRPLHYSAAVSDSAQGRFGAGDL
jgi:isopenicillin N synthase-like dioxygenase